MSMGKRPGSFILAALAGTGILIAIQAFMAKNKLGNRLKEIIATEQEPSNPDRMLSLAIIGDSLGVGMGAENYQETPGVLIAKQLAEHHNCYVRYNNYATSGAATCELAAQVTKAIQIKPDIVLMIVGTNDITGLKSQHKGLEHLHRSISLLHAAGIKVFLVPCIDLHIVTAIGNPLRSLLGKMSQQYAKAQANTARKLGAIVIEYQQILSKFNHRSMFSIDNYHPSSEGYAIIAEEIVKIMLEHYRPNFG